MIGIWWYVSWEQAGVRLIGVVLRSLSTWLVVVIDRTVGSRDCCRSSWRILGLAVADMLVCQCRQVLPCRPPACPPAEAGVTVPRQTPPTAHRAQHSAMLLTASWCQQTNLATMRWSKRQTLTFVSLACRRQSRVKNKLSLQVCEDILHVIVFSLASFWISSCRLWFLDIVSLHLAVC